MLNSSHILVVIPRALNKLLLPRSLRGKTVARWLLAFIFLAHLKIGVSSSEKRSTETAVAVVVTGNTRSLSKPSSPSTSEASTPSTSEPNAPSTSQPNAPSTSQPNAPSTNEPEAPSTSEPGAPSTSMPSSLSTSKPSLPSTSSLSTSSPSMSSPSMSSPSTSSPSTSSPSTSYTSYKTDGNVERITRKARNIVYLSNANGGSRSKTNIEENVVASGKREEETRLERGIRHSRENTTRESDANSVSESTVNPCREQQLRQETRVEDCVDRNDGRDESLGHVYDYPYNDENENDENGNDEIVENDDAPANHEVTDNDDDDDDKDYAGFAPRFNISRAQDSARLTNINHRTLTPVNWTIAILTNTELYTYDLHGAPSARTASLPEYRFLRDSFAAEFRTRRRPIAFRKIWRDYRTQRLFVLEGSTGILFTCTDHATDLRNLLGNHRSHHVIDFDVDLVHSYLYFIRDAGGRFVDLLRIRMRPNQSHVARYVTDKGRVLTTVRAIDIDECRIAVSPNGLEVHLYYRAQRDEKLLRVIAMRNTNQFSSTRNLAEAEYMQTLRKNIKTTDVPWTSVPCANGTSFVVERARTMFDCEVSSMFGNGENALMVLQACRCGESAHATRRRSSNSDPALSQDLLVFSERCRATLLARNSSSTPLSTTPETYLFGRSPKDDACKTLSVACLAYGHATGSTDTTWLRNELRAKQKLASSCNKGGGGVPTGHDKARSFYAVAAIESPYVPRRHRPEINEVFERSRRPASRETYATELVALPPELVFAGSWFLDESSRAEATVLQRRGNADLARNWLYEESQRPPDEAMYRFRANGVPDSPSPFDRRAFRPRSLTVLLKIPYLNAAWNSDSLVGTVVNHRRLDEFLNNCAYDPRGTVCQPHDDDYDAKKDLSNKLVIEGIDYEDSDDVTDDDRGKGSRKPTGYDDNLFYILFWFVMGIVLVAIVSIVVLAATRALRLLQQRMDNAVSPRTSEGSLRKTIVSGQV